MASDTIFRPQWSIRQDKSQLAALREVFDTIPEAERPTTQREFFEYIVEIVKNKPSATTENNTEYVLELQAENTRLKFEYDQLYQKITTTTNEVVAKALTGTEPVEVRLLKIHNTIEPLRFDLSAAFKSLFNDADCPEVTTEQTIEMMLDYCQRDPSQEFPFEPVARKIYNELKKPSENGSTTTEG